MREYKTTLDQKALASKLFELDQDNLFYIVSQPHEQKKNHTIKELKKHIKGGLKTYTQKFLGYDYFKGAENQLFKYIAFIEYPKEYYLALSRPDEDITSLYSGAHFHLFITTKLTSIVNMEQVASQILIQLCKQKLKADSIRKFSCNKVIGLTREFAEYHTKQHYHYTDKERIMINL